MNGNQLFIGNQKSVQSVPKSIDSLLILRFIQNLSAGLAGAGYQLVVGLISWWIISVILVELIHALGGSTTIARMLRVNGYV